MQENIRNKSESRVEFLDGIRGFAALWVVFGHILSTLWNDNAKRFPSPALHSVLRWFPTPRWSVIVFIVLSGYCLMLGTKNDRIAHVGRYYWKRCRRILPTYYAALLIACVLGCTVLSRQAGTAWDAALPVTRAAVISHLFLVHNIGNLQSRIDYPMWTIAVEWQIYLVFPAILWLWRRVPQPLIVLCLLPVSFAFAFITRHGFMSAAHFQFLFLFVLGMLCVSAARSPARWALFLTQNSGLILILGAAVALGTDIINGWMGGFYTWRYERYYDFAIGFFAFAVLLHAQRERSFLGSVFAWRPLVFVGTFSYSLYLIHALVLQIVWQHGLLHLQGPELFRFLVTTAAEIAACLGASYLFFLAFERPFLSGAPRSLRVIEVKTALEPAI